MTPKRKGKMNFVRKRQGPPRRGLDGLLRRRIESIQCRSKRASVEQLVDCLRAEFPEYNRHKLQPFTKSVQQIIEDIYDRSNEVNDDEKNHSKRKRPKKVEEDEERLQLIEEQHLRKRAARINHDSENDVGSSSSIASASSSGSESDNSSAEDLSSEDAIYEEKFEPKIDLMKSMLRQNYNEKSKKLGDDGEKKEVMEMEVVNNEDKEVNLMMNERRKTGNDFKLSKNEGGNGLTVRNKKNTDINNNNNNGPFFRDLGGISEILEELKMEVIVPFYHPHLAQHLGVRPISGILFHGPPGCGKTKLANAIANETGVPFYKICATELVSGVSGSSEENIRDLFSKAQRTAPSIVFIDEIDAIATKRENSNRVMEQRIVTQLMSCMDESSRICNPIKGSETAESSCKPGYVLVIGATNRPDSIDPALRRSGRFDREIFIGFPDERARVDILSVLSRNLKVEGSFDLLKIAKSTSGFVGADLASLTDKAGNLAMKRIIGQRKALVSVKPQEGEPVEEWWRLAWSPEEIEKLRIAMADFEEAAKSVQPSAKREGFSAIPSEKWEDVGGVQLLRELFDRDIVRRIKNPEVYEEFGVDSAKGFLLYGPPGCGKTLIAKAVANEAGANFIHIKGPELLNKYVGETELAVRTIFTRARACSPCILFFDEVDALTTKRSEEGAWVVSRPLNQLLVELDGGDQRKGIYIISATNRPDAMDEALLRPGRFGKPIYVPLPSPNERGLILTAHGRKKPVDPNVDLMAIGSSDDCKNFSGADLSALMNEAAMMALEDKLNSRNTNSNSLPGTIQEIHFKQALKKISPSVSDVQIRFYEHLSEKFKWT